MYDDWNARPAGFSQATFVSDLRARLQTIRKAEFSVLIPPPIPGLGEAGGFQMMLEDRRGIGPGEMQKGVHEIVRHAAGDPARRMLANPFSATSPKPNFNGDRPMAGSPGLPINSVVQTLQTYLGSTYVNQFNEFNQSLQVRVQADAEYRRRIADVANLYVSNR